LGLNASCGEQIKIEKKFITNKVVLDEGTNKISFPIEHMGESHIFSIEQIIALFLVKLKEFYDTANISVTDGIVFTIPSYASNVERQSLYDAIEIAGLKCPRIINESTSIALNYGFFKRKDFTKEKAKTVVFVDFGHCKTTITVAQFWPEKVKIVCHHSDRNLGGRDFDYVIMEKLGGEFEKKFGCDPREQPRCVLRMMEGIEKARKILSADKEAGINVDFLLEEEDLVRSLKRDEFEEMVAPCIKRFETLLTETIALSGLTSEDIDSIELVGDATRTPCIQETIKAVFGKEECSRTLNALDTVCRGACLQAAILSPTYNVAAFNVEDYNSLPISITYTFADKPDAPKMMTLFDVGTSFPVTKSLSFKNKLGNMNLLIHYQEGSKLMQGLPLQLANYTIKEGKMKHSDKGSKAEFIIKVENSIHQIAYLQSA